jgi:hypothetical protein
MKRCYKIGIIVAIVLIPAAFIDWFCIIPRHLFHLGMGMNEVQKIVGTNYQKEPLATAFSSNPPTDFELTHTPVYKVSIPLRGVTLLINSKNEVTFIGFLIGPSEGTQDWTLPKSSGG